MMSNACWPSRPAKSCASAGIEHTEVGGPLLGLGDESGTLRMQRRHAVENDAGGGAVSRTGLDAHPRLGDDAQDALAADDDAVGRRAGAAAGEPAGFPDSGRCNHAHGLYKVVDVGVVGGVVASAAGGNPTAQGRELEALREVAQGVAGGGAAGLRDAGPRTPAWMRAARDSVVNFQHLVQDGSGQW